MHILEAKIREAGTAGRMALIPFVTAGFPSRERFWDVLRELDGAGADIIEIGVPFPDPVADGPVVEAASQRALESGVTLRGIMRELAERRGELKAGLILMGYMPTIYWLNLIYYLVYGIVFLASLAMVTSVLSMIALDTQKLIQALIRLLFYLTPILWSLDRMPPQIGKMLRLNPVLYYVDGFRESLLYQVAFYHNPKKMLFFWLINVVLFTIGCNLIMKYKEMTYL